MAELIVGTIGGHDFALRSDRVLETVAVTGISRFMRGERADVVAAVVNEKITFLSDPAIRLGLAAADHDGQAAVITSARKQIAGLLFDSSPQKLVVEDAELLPVAPSLVRSPYEACFRYSGHHVGVLSESFFDSMQESDRPSLDLAAASRATDSDSAGEFLRVVVGSREVALDAAGCKPVRGVLDSLVPLVAGDTPVIGIAPHEGQMIPVVDLRRALGVDDSRRATATLIWSSASGAIALAVEGVREHEAAERAVYEIPRLLRRPDIARVLFHESGAVPVVDIPVLFASSASADESVYYPASDFARRVQEQDITVVEISYGGFTYAIPEGEVSDTVTDFAATTLSIEHPLVDDVALMDDRLVPVLNLTRYLGHGATEEFADETLVIANGDFCAALRPQRVVGKRQVARKSQRPLPMDAPHGVLYGCYVDGPDVRLILNLAAIAQHARDTTVQSALSSLGKQDGTPSDDEKVQPQLSHPNEQPVSHVAQPPGVDPEPEVSEAAPPQPSPTVGGTEEASKQPEAENPAFAAADVPESATELEESEQAADRPQPDDSGAGEEPIGGTGEAAERTELPEETIDDETFPSLEDEVEDLPLSVATPATRPADAPEAMGTEEPKADDESQPRRKRSLRWLLAALPLLFPITVVGLVLFAPQTFGRLTERFSAAYESAAEVLDRDAAEERETVEEPEPEVDPETDLRDSDPPEPADVEPTPPQPVVPAPEADEPETDTTATAPPAGPRVERMTERVFFRADSWELLPQARETLDSVIARMDDPSQWHVEITGHSARAGTATGAQWLSEQRATVVHDYLLTQLREAPDEIDAIGVGAGQPAESNATDEGMARNRRVVIELESVGN